MGASVGSEGPHGRKRHTVVRLVKHVTIPDGTAMHPGQEFVKTWRVRNDSQNPWPQHCELIHVGGETLDIPEDVIIPGGLVPNTGCNVSVNLKAPTDPGRYKGFFRLRRFQLNDGEEEKEGLQR